MSHSMVIYELQVTFKFPYHNKVFSWLRADNSQLDNAGGVPVSDGLSAFGKVTAKAHHKVIESVYVILFY